MHIRVHLYRQVTRVKCLRVYLNKIARVLLGSVDLHWTFCFIGNSAACEMILEVRGDIGALQDMDNFKRTPAHLAAICGQGEVVNFLLDQGGW